MPTIGIVVGNGLAIDYCQTHSDSHLLPDPSDPFQWEFGVPDDSALNWQQAFPLLRQTIDGIGFGVNSFEAFASLLAEVQLRNPNDSVRLDAEARQFLVFAYSAFQQEIDRIGVAEWRWRRWIGEHASDIAGAVSFNYDRLFESAANSVGLHLPSFAVRSGSQGCFFLKPHGSIDFECDPCAISMPPSRYPLVNWATLNDVPLIALAPNALRQPRQEAFVVLPTETSPYLGYQWVAPGYERWRGIAGNLTHCILIGLSYWRCDREEIDFLIDALAPGSTVIIANPQPPDELVARILASGRHCIEWRNGPQNFGDVA